MPASFADHPWHDHETDGASAAVRLRSVTVEYRLGGGSVVSALRDVDLVVEAGERVALLGSSGAGKSSLLEVVAGLTAPVAGDVEVLGRAIGQLRRRELRSHRAEVGVIRQHHGLPASLRVIHNVNGGRLGSWSSWRATTSLVWPRARSDVEAALGRVGLAGVVDRRTGDLSGGQQQRVAVARALIEPRRLLLADEPVSAVDPSLSDEVLARICAGDDTSVLMSLHDPSLARRFADRIVGLSAGGVVFDLAAAEVTDQHLDDLYRTASRR